MTKIIYVSTCPASGIHNESKPVAWNKRTRCSKWPATLMCVTQFYHNSNLNRLFGVIYRGFPPSLFLRRLNVIGGGEEKRTRQILQFRRYTTSRVLPCYNLCVPFTSKCTLFERIMINVSYRSVFRRTLFINWYTFTKVTGCGKTTKTSKH